MLTIDYGDSAITVSLTAIKNKIDQRLIDLGYMTREEIDQQPTAFRQRILWIQDDDLKLLERHYQEAAPLGLLFQTGTRNKIDTRFLRALVASMRVRSGLEKGVHPHLLRHTFATDLLRETKNLPLVMKSLGHADIGTTQIYLHIVDDELEAALKNFRRK
jgi:integrase/recombinase XerD